MFLSTPTFCLGYLRKCTREQLGTIRYLLVGAEKLRPTLVKSFEEKFGVTPLEGYGCTEMGPVVSVNVTHHERSAYKPGTAGRPLPHISLRIVDPETLTPLAAGETGLLLVNGPSRMLGYLGDPENAPSNRWWTVTIPPATSPTWMAMDSCKLSIVWRASAKSRAKWCRT